MIERKLIDPLVADRHRAGRQQGRVQRVARRGGVRSVRHRAQEPEGQDLVARRARRVDSLLERDPALGERSGLVSEKDLDVAEVLDADQPLDHHTLAGQVAGTGGQADCDYRRQQLRREPDGNREREERRLEDRATQKRVGHEDPARQQRGHSHQQDREAAQPTLEHGLGLPLAQLDRDLAEFGARPGLQDDTAPGPPADGRPHVGDRAQAQLDEISARLRLGALRFRHRLAGEHRFIAFELASVQQPQVGRHQVAGSKEHDVARHQLGDVDRGRDATPEHERPVADAGVKRLDDAFRSVFVEESEADAEGDDGQDDDRVGSLADDERNDRGGGEEDEQGVAKLAPKDCKWPSTMAADRVGAVLLEPGRGLLRGEAALRAAQASDDVGRRRARSGDEIEAVGRSTVRGDLDRHEASLNPVGLICGRPAVSPCPAPR